MPAPINIYAGNSRTVTFRLRRTGVVAPADVSDATAIVLEYTTESGEPHIPIVCDPDADGADWAQGLVVVDLTAVAAKPYGTYQWWLTLTRPTSTITWDSGTIEVLKRPVTSPVD